RRFAGARRSNDRQEFAALDLEIHAAERLYVHLADPVNFAKILDLDDGRLTHTREPRSGPCGQRAGLDTVRPAPRRRAQSQPQPATRPDPPRAGRSPEPMTESAIWRRSSYRSPEPYPQSPEIPPPPE